MDCDLRPKHVGSRIKFVFGMVMGFIFHEKIVSYETRDSLILELVNIQEK